MKKSCLNLLILIFFQIFIAGASAQEGLTEYVGAAGAVNWTTAKVSAIGYGSASEKANKLVAPLLACRAAIVDAQRNLLESTQGVRVNSNTTVSNFVASNDEIKTSVEGTVKGATIKSREPQTDGTCKVELEISLQGPMTKQIMTVEDNLFATFTQRFIGNPLQQLATFSLLPKAHASESNDLQILMDRFNHLESRLLELEKNLSLPGATLSPEDTQEQLPTGLVIDARGSNFIPSLSPKVRKLRGNIVYPSGEDKSRLIRSGRLVSLFTRKLDHALSHPTVGDTPLLVKALRTWGDTRTEIVLNIENADKISSFVNTDFFNQAGVIIVLD